MSEPNPAAVSLRFDLHCRSVSVDAAQVPVLTPLAYVGEVALFGSKVPYVNTLSLLLYGTAQGEFELCSCSCGVAECAGFFEGVRVEVDDANVTWHIPKDGYDRVINPELGAGPWVLRMEKTALAHSLHELESRILALEGEEPRTQVSPFDGCFEEEDEPLAVVLSRLRSRSS